MTSKEFTRLRQLELSIKRRFRPTNMSPSRRSVRSMRNATGQVLKNSRVVAQIPLERVYRPYV